MEEYISKAITEYRKTTHGRIINDDVRDMITWLIRRRAEMHGMDSLEEYIEGSKLWEDLIDRINPDRD